MIFYSLQTSIGLLLASFPATISILAFFYYYRKKLALQLLVLSAFLLRLLMSAIDPFLHNWDERFHALVAKNMMKFPFKPMLHSNPIFPYNFADWSTNHIWLHKQPLFLWQMAFSMKNFGVNEIAMRLPSVLMGTISIYFIYKIAEFWFKSETTAYLAALIFTFSNYQLGLTSGRYALDHNDVAFTFYVTASIWALTRYIHSNFKIHWAIIIGIFVGCAVLNKWLTGLLIYGGWGLNILIDKNYRHDYKKYFHFALSVIIACIVFLPWQIYISNNFPLESAFELNANSKHITEAMQNQHGGYFYHIRFLPEAYGSVFLIFLFVGLAHIFAGKVADKKLSIAYLSMVGFLFFFFSIIVKTKMPAFVYPASAIIIPIIALGITKSFEFLTEKYPKKMAFGIPTIVLLLVYFDLNPSEIAKQSSETFMERNAILNNTRVYKSLNDTIVSKYIILNCKSFEDKDLMFYKNSTAYAWYPNKIVFDSLQHAGYKFATFKNHNNQILPDYIQNSKSVLFIDADLK